MKPLFSEYTMQCILKAAGRLVQGQPYKRPMLIIRPSGWRVTERDNTVAGIAYALGQDIYLWEDGEWQESDGNFE
jgi:hypothetical protein